MHRDSQHKKLEKDMGCSMEEKQLIGRKIEKPVNV